MVVDNPENEQKASGKISRKNFVDCLQIIKDELRDIQSSVSSIKDVGDIQSLDSSEKGLYFSEIKASSARAFNSYKSILDTLKFISNKTGVKPSILESIINVIEDGFVSIRSQIDNIKESPGVEAVLRKENSLTTIKQICEKSLICIEVLGGLFLCGETLKIVHERKPDNETCPKNLPGRKKIVIVNNKKICITAAGVLFLCNKALKFHCKKRNTVISILTARKY
jgi:hypothetical protein